MEKGDRVVWCDQSVFWVLVYGLWEMLGASAKRMYHLPILRMRLVVPW